MREMPAWQERMLEIDNRIKRLTERRINDEQELSDLRQEKNRMFSVRLGELVQEQELENATA